MNIVKNVEKNIIEYNKIEQNRIEQNRKEYNRTELGTLEWIKFNPNYLIRISTVETYNLSP